ncbi:type II toxin-antitoxin system death-on-curing family toxin [candidate division WWE3 bacterium CG10_big_fil_rev_8_21_14_0_10_32_10]|uniref:Type II toxin-antitoxin system death-on-curing family toxin n=1 Tax=candidate division WWE3 bacterium CG10_big_fil_rev_8_21_14_0_10_32_10 TaxID=1975090 RepID=A0A2H0RAQ5_UNCKA|nr:MAG: type II toxin-antitoxin system death-on-curing family toxin [candidate division WWE3 bacterium CG10_big_fil_rev_8_21_14_0_10_32_10]
MQYLNLEEILAIHYEIIKQTGGSQGIRDINLLYSTIERPKSYFTNKPLYKGIYNKAVALLHSLVLNHAFLDGNKRTGIAATSRFLYINGCILTPKKDQTHEFLLKIINKKVDFNEIVQWLKENAEKI